MQNIRPCPYCGGEVEVVRLEDNRTTHQKQYRIECLQCRRLVPKGTKFEADGYSAGKERIAQYEEELMRQLGGNDQQTHSSKILLSMTQQKRDRLRADPPSGDDEAYDIHDANQRNIPRRRRKYEYQ